MLTMALWILKNSVCRYVYDCIYSAIFTSIIQASYNEVTASNNVQHPDLEELAYGTRVSCLSLHKYSVSSLILLMLAGYLAALPPLSVVDGRVTVDLSKRLMRQNSFSLLARKLPLFFGLKCLVTRGLRSVNVPVSRSFVASGSVGLGPEIKYSV